MSLKEAKKKNSFSKNLATVSQAKPLLNKKKFPYLENFRSPL